MQKWCVVLLALAAILAGCDKRDAEKPDMTFTASRDTLTNTVPTQNYCTLTVRLEGTEGSTLYERINFTYDTTLGTIVGDSSSTSAYTDSLGFATVEFVADADAVGPVYITASMEKFHSVNKTLVLTVIDCPELAATAAQDSVLADGQTQVVINVQLSSGSNNIAGQVVNFASDLALQYAQMVTDDNGRCVNYVTAPSTAGAYETEVSLEDFPRSVTITHTFVEP